MTTNKQLRITVANTNGFYKSIESRVSALMAENGILFTRLALGVIFLWFGVLKFAPGQSPAEDLAKRTLVKLTFGHIPAQVCLYILAVWECAIGLGFLCGRFVRSTLILLFLQLPGTFLPLLFFPSETWKHIPYSPTLEGQYILKNLVLISAGIIIVSTMRGGTIVSDPSVARIAGGMQHFYTKFRQRFQHDPEAGEALRVAHQVAKREDSASNSDRS
jgi:uncharacterized membrane protein YphA (DoxX/SURF4 family)